MARRGIEKRLTAGPPEAWTSKKGWRERERGEEERRGILEESVETGSKAHGRTARGSPPIDSHEK